MMPELKEALAKQTADSADLLKQLLAGFVVILGIGEGLLTLEGAFDDFDKLLAAVAEYQGKKYNWYSTLNELSRDNPPPVWKFRPNQLVPVRKGESCTNANIARRRSILIDLDRTEELKKLGPATISEKEKIYIRSKAVLIFLTHNGIGAAPHIVQADSGNGRHQLVRVDLPNDDASTSLVKRFLEALALKFNGDGVEIDTKVFDAKRITRLYGTMNFKGTPTKEIVTIVEGKPVVNIAARLHRKSRLFKPDPLFGKEGPVTAQQLEAVIASIATMPKPVATTSSAKGPATVEDVMTWATHFGQELVEETSSRFAVRNPACSGRHGGKNPATTSTRIFVTDGHLGFECHHSSCSKLTWPGYRTIVETGRPYLFPWESEEAEIEEAAPLAAYPIEVWDGTMYAKYAEACTEGNFIPSEFFIETVKTVVGAIAGTQISGDLRGMESARSYTILSAVVSAGKGTAIRQACELFKFYYEDIGTEPSADLVWGAGSTPKYKQIGAVQANLASEPALYEAGSLCPRVLLTPAELDMMLSKTRIEGSGPALLSQLRELYDSPYVNASTTASRKMKDVPRIVHLSLLTSTQPSTFEELISEGLGTGMLSRFTIVRSDETRTVDSIPIPKLRTIKTALMQKVEALEAYPFRATLSPDAKEVMKAWYAKIRDIARSHDNEQQRESTARLNIVVLRNVLHLAWLLDEPLVSAETMRKATLLGDYQLSQRSALIGSPTNNDSALMQSRITKCLRQKGKLSRRNLYKAVSADRFGTRIFDQALEGLKREGLVLELSGERRNQKFYALRKESE